MMDNIGKLVKAFSEKETNKTKQTGHENKTRCPNKSGGNTHIIAVAGCNAD
jgi:hypothetical protein